GTGRSRLEPTILPAPVCGNVTRGSEERSVCLPGQVRLLRQGALTAALLVLAGCGHGSKLYSAQDAKRAFAREGFVLVPMGIEHRILVPKSAEPFTGVVARTE